MMIWLFWIEFLHLASFIFHKFNLCVIYSKLSHKGGKQRFNKVVKITPSNLNNIEIYYIYPDI